MPDSVPTAIPAFVGYTETATFEGESAYLAPVRLGSLADYEAVFGGGSKAASRTSFILYDSVRLFYANGGGPCYVCSVGSYADGAGGVDKKKLADGLTAVGAAIGPTLIAIPEAVLLPSAADFANLTRQMLAQCATLRDRIAILDVYGTDTLHPAKPTYRADLDVVIGQFHDCVGDTSLDYGAAYFPFLVTSIFRPGEPVLPPSGAIAGVCAAVDSTRGVWNAPANITLNSVVRPSLQINEEQQASMNVPVDGKAINVIRDFVGRGPVVWGARTLDGNSMDYRYVNVRRTIVYIETWIKAALGDYVSATNDATTWRTVLRRVSDFLQNLWTQGGLSGDRPGDAFTVQCGLGSTMTGTDILEGRLILLVTVALIRPAEFIELTFTQQMRP
jgi:phage tail sheath protein FI